MSKHTPGPWTPIVDDCEASYRMALVSTHANGDRVVAIDCTRSGESYEQDAANARLIAATTDLLKALRACSTWMKEHGCVPPCLNDAFVAIAKATGETQ